MICASCGATFPEVTPFCKSCGKPIIGYNITPAAEPSASPAVALPIGVDELSYVIYAGFWLRFVAVIIDSFVLAIPLLVLLFLMFASVLPSLMQMHPQNSTEIMTMFLPRITLFGLLAVAVSWLYWALMESSGWQATLGKKALGIYVTDMRGTRVTFGRASGRFFAGRGLGSVPSIGGLYFLIDCVMAGFTEKKQALHDMMASCLVLRRV
jgi:uncharacterized RDD family membrane protein YckC